MLSKKKKVFILAGMVALLVLTGCLNIFLNKNKAEPIDDVVTYASFFDAYRATREDTRAGSVALLNEIIYNPASTADAISSANESKIKMSHNNTVEDTLEGLIKALGFIDAVVTASTENINVIVKSETISATQAAQILDIIISETGTAATGVRIIPVA